MPRIFPGRFTAEIDQPFVVFLIGMRINQLWAVHKWLPVMQSMVPMLNTLHRHKEKGLLAEHSWLTWREVMTVQYWRSFEDLERFARSASEPHLPAWKRYNQKVGADGSVGIWHETFLVDAKKYECVYGNMPLYGLAAASKHVEAVGNKETARLRIGGKDEPAVPSPQNPA